MSKEKNNQTETKWIGVGIFAAFLASLCCITPVVALVAGVSGAAATFSWIEPFRPYIIGLTLLLLGYAWYRKLKPNWDPDCACEENPSFLNSKSFLGIVTVVAALLISFPYYSTIFTSKPDQKVIYVQKDQVETASFNIEGMTCAGCESAVLSAAHGVEGVLEASASYENQNAVVKFNKEKTTIPTIIEAINKTGFIASESAKIN